MHTSFEKIIITARNSSCGKVMFLQVSVCPGGGMHGRGGMCGRGCAWWLGHVGACMGEGACMVGGACVAGGVHAGETATDAGGTHPTGMHSC